MLGGENNWQRPDKSDSDPLTLLPLSQSRSRLLAQTPGLRRYTVLASSHIIPLTLSYEDCNPPGI